MPTLDNSFVAVPIRRWTASGIEPLDDFLATEEPLEIRLGFGPASHRQSMSISITMRTPGCDEALAIGFLLSEGLLTSPQDILEVRSCGANPHGQKNVVRVELADTVVFDHERFKRHFYTTSSCGVCGKASIEALMQVLPPPLPTKSISYSAASILTAAQRLSDMQQVFRATGGLHATALFDAAGHILTLQEDVGRHNAFDKAVGMIFPEYGRPLPAALAFVSGRASFELVQKALMAGIPIMCAIGAPSSLAVELAKKFHLTLIGFVRGERFNVYHDEDRIVF